MVRGLYYKLAINIIQKISVVTSTVVSKTWITPALIMHPHGVLVATVKFTMSPPYRAKCVSHSFELILQASAVTQLP